MTVRYVSDGSQVRALEDFWRVTGESIGSGGYFGRNPDAFADASAVGSEHRTATSDRAA